MLSAVPVASVSKGKWVRQAQRRRTETQEHSAGLGLMLQTDTDAHTLTQTLSFADDAAAQCIREINHPEE